MSDERKARIANGLLVLVSGLLACLVDLRFAWLTLFMGASLIFSGAHRFLRVRGHLQTTAPFVVNTFMRLSREYPINRVTTNQLRSWLSRSLVLAVDSRSG